MACGGARRHRDRSQRTRIMLLQYRRSSALKPGRRILDFGRWTARAERAGFVDEDAAPSDDPRRRPTPRRGSRRRRARAGGARPRNPGGNLVQ